MKKFQFGGPITKYERNDDGTMTVYGTVTAEVVDKQGDIVPYEEGLAALEDPDYPGNIREMHTSKVVGRIQAIYPKPDEKPRRIDIDVLVSKSRDGQDVQTKIEEGLLTGFSIAGRSGTKVTKNVNGEMVSVLGNIKLSEVSFVDNPACPNAKILLAKADGAIDEAEPAEVAPEPADPAADELGAVALLAQVRDSLIALAGMEVSELGEEGTAAAHEILALIDRVELLRGMKVTQAAIEAAGEISMSAPTGDVSKGIVSAELNKKAFARIRKMGEALKAMSAEIAELEKEFGEAQEEAAEKPEEEPAEPKEEAPAEDEPKKVAEKSTPTGDVAKSVSEPDILKAFGELVEKANEGLRKEVSALASEVESFRNQPRSGGPVRTAAVEKTLAGMAPGAESKDPDIAELVMKASANLPPHEAEKMRAAMAFEMLKVNLPR